MEVIETVQSCIKNWKEGGESECRATLVEPHCRLAEQSCLDVLSTAYETLLHAILRTWSVESKLTTEDLTLFIKSLLDGLPSSSSSTEEGRKPQHALLFGELIVDLVWAIDSELDEILADARLLSGGATETGGESAQAGRATASKELAEHDKSVLGDLVKKLLTSGIVEPSTCRERLDMSLLTMVGLIGDRAAFERKEIRTRTALFYKQNKFNLLREQSEGYAKLTTDLIASLGPPHSSATALPAESRKAVCARAAVAWDRVVSLIGYFDLDPNRALDIILDVFSVNIATHWQFFIALLACSPWAPDTAIIREWEDSESQMKIEQAKDVYRGKRLDDVLRTAESLARGGSGEHLNSPASSASTANTKPKVLAQVLGFKFSHYQSAETKEACPKGLFLAAALLIREGFITLEDLYPHLGPSDEDMPKLKQKYLDDVQSRIKLSSNNLLATAAPLESSSSSGPSSKPKSIPTSESTQVQETKEAPAQKAMIVIALLSVGVMRPAIAIMTRFPWLVDVHREIADLILRALKHSVAPLYESMFGKERNLSFLKPRSRYVSPGNIVAPSRKTQLTLCAPAPPSTLTLEFVFFYPLWSEWVPQCATMDDLVDVVEPIMRFIGLHVSREPLFLTKLLRIGRVQLAQSVVGDADSKEGKKAASPITEPEDPIQNFWLCVARRYLLPALSMMPGNAVCTVEVWNILKQFDTTIRWRLYGEWRDVTYKSHPELNVQRILREREAKGVLRRLSSQTVESLSGTVAKMAHSNPCIFFTNAVNQIQAYDNLADVVIQALRYATNMGFDILVFLILDSLANTEKERVKEDGANISDWLQSLATFTGALFRRYSTDLSPVLRYIVHQLYGGQTSEIVVLEKLILKMAGIEPLPSLSDTQITAMAGGPTLRIEAIASDIRGAGFEASEVSLKGTQRLGKTLVETKLAFPILVQVVQQRQACVFKARDAHLKSIAYLFDATHGVLYQYLDLLTTPLAVSLDEYRSILPPLSELGTSYGFPPPISMQVIRPLLNDAILKHAQKWCQLKDAEKAESAEAAEKRLKAALTAKRDPTINGTPQDATSNVLLSEGSNADLSKDTDKMEVDAAANGDALEVKIEEKSDEIVALEVPWIPELYALFDQSKEIAPENAYEIIGPGFFLTFWQMTSYDLYFPKEKYDETLKSLIATSEVHYQKAKQAERASDRTTRLSAISHRNQRERYLLIASDLKKERVVQETVHRYTTEKDGRIDKEKAHWFSHVGQGKVTGAAFIQALIEYCIQPRCLLSPMDADYCARLIRTLHERGTPGFHTLMCYDKLLGDHVKVVIFSCSENEARNYGRFLKGVLTDLYSWHQSQKAYDASNRLKENSKVTLLPGFQTHWSRDGPSAPENLLGWPGFKSFLKKCHRKLGKSFMECIQAGDFMHVYNSVLVLKEVIEVFPIAAVNEVVGSNINMEIQRLVQTEERGDLKILARAYSSSLKKRESIWAMPKGAQVAKPSAKSTPSTTDKSSVSIANATSSEPQNVQPPALPTKIPDAPANRSGSTGKIATLESIPRPEVVRRNRVDSRPPESNPTGTSEKGEAMGLPSKPTGLSPAPPPVQPKQEIPTQISSQPARPPPRPSGVSANDLRKEVLQGVNGHSRPATPQAMQTSSLDNNVREGPQSHLPRAQEPVQKPMAPPSTPSQTLSAQELRSTRVGSRAERAAQSPRPDPSKSPAVRSPSPATRPGTRNASADSGRSADREKERGRYDRPQDAEVADDGKRAAANLEIPSRAERSSAHREVLHGRSERNGRDRIPGSSTRDLDRDRDSDREREKGRDREKERDRDREKREREPSHRERDRERDRDHRDRDRDRDRDRHRREDKERDRERREPRAAGSDLPQEGATASRTDGSRHRTRTGSAHSDETLGKRRRPADDEPERSSKRGSRRDGHREERSRRGSEKESSRDQPRDNKEQPRESERRRRERDAPEEMNNIKGAANEKLDRPRGSEPSPISPTPKTPILPPSAPRAMAIQPPRPGGRGDVSPVLPIMRDRDRDNERERNDRDRSERTSRNDRTDRGERPERSDNKGDRGDKPDRGEREWRTNRETAASQESTGIRSGPANGTALTPQNSLFDRIGPISNASGLSPNLPGRRPVGVYEDASDARKRTLSERERDAPTDTGPKKIKIRREGLNDSGRILGKTLSSVYGSDASRNEGRRGGNS